MGDRVLVKNCTESGDTRKLRSYLENEIYKIVHCIREDSLLYKVQPEKIQDGN